MYPINYSAKTDETTANENRSHWANREGVHIYNLEFADRWESKTRNCGAAELAETHPSPEDNTSADAAPRQIRPPQSACAGKSPHRASRNSYSLACTCGRNEAPCSQSVEGGNEEDRWFNFHSNKQLRQTMKSDRTALLKWPAHSSVNYHGPGWFMLFFFRSAFSKSFVSGSWS